MTDLQFNIIRKLFWVVSILIFGALLVFLALEDRVPSGIRTIVHENEWSSGIEGWGPAHRITSLSNNQVQINIDPVYLRVFLPRKFQDVDIVLWYKDPSKKIDRMGAQLINGRYDNWQFNLTEFSDLESIGGWQKSYVSLSLENADFTDRAYRFILSAPGLDKQSQKLEIKKIQLTFYREPLSWSKIKKILHLN
ncbi:MAG: hypothetical protein HOJ15_03815 [Candidatus Jacksonbacteria bacterium]|nr:hypothetical protein [Candidatus Jacksonbacteria bacterium]